MPEVVLWHIRFSNFNEKARWALDHKRVPHVRRGLDSGVHPLVAAALTRGAHKTFPLLQIDGRTIGDSTAIIAELERRFPEPPLYPDDPGERRRALELEDFFDESYGHEVRRAAFWALFADDETGVLGMRELAGPLPEPVLRALLPPTRASLFRYYGISEESARGARERILAGFDRIEAERAGGDHLVGDRFSVADLTAAALIAPVFMPPGFPWRPRSGLHPGLERLRDELGRHPAADWVRRTYERHRAPAGSAAGSGSAAEPSSLSAVSD
jgi:glutathione S-transferase